MIAFLITFAGGDYTVIHDRHKAAAMVSLDHVVDVQEIPNQIEDWDLEEQLLHTLG